MASYLVEGYAPIDPSALASAVARIRAAADALVAGGRAVRHVEAILVPEDETCFHLVEAASIEDVRELLRRADLSEMRITEAVGGPDPQP